MTDKTFLDNAYDLPDAKATQSFYDDWAESYDAEIAENGYATPTRCAEALARHLTDPGAPVLDIGCGTGLSGVALKMQGFTQIDGTDLSSEMLERAGERFIYRNLFAGDMNRPLPVPDGLYTAATAVGVINPGHAPPETIDGVLDMLPTGGYLVFSLNDHALAEPAFPAKVDEVVTSGRAACLEREHGEHLPGIGLKSTVFVLQKS